MDKLLSSVDQKFGKKCCTSHIFFNKIGDALLFGYRCTLSDH